MSKNWSLILVAAFALGFGLKSYLDLQNETSPATEDSSVTLFGENNQAVSLFDPNDERVRVVYFGFTRCPDVCPTSLAMLAGALNQIDQPIKDQFRPIFISLDPERDAAADSYKYAQYFHPMIEGLSAPLDVTTPLAHKYGVIFRKTELENSELKYTLDHSSYFYFLKPDGTLITKVPHTLTPAPLVEAFKTITSKG
ncbi:cytochrome oxidase biogenesis protein Sco1/SenC/PrrC copper metallochaperone [Vibrio orientalis CIP 102891 = ATCC 33934]|uniref:Cytochrome oxidase biogenesis protein Sco1/SenC/PrrC copper metallochaperone n=1 Tax=Vibrio orientalis CIP 102891 = ATCC 33934 TaxID=675816 RepID=C9QEF0_VIBOR|nr:SCO family protein [Vibrio orientalis]EEX94423.1 cytochrome oxidase biogenesis protein Sco1/SenC/PrrC putative copper metallochaperone [Vibrio orientalis CIP 102891 = ATCC 33934]EGU54028.1 cytochrome oxidase biogenesis protein Sco1/SenC/PrrC copper metallochaperone [Vibrio orientalis CIP 102891 = ATCC 33934]